MEINITIPKEKKEKLAEIFNYEEMKYSADGIEVEPQSIEIFLSNEIKDLIEREINIRQKRNEERKIIIDKISLDVNIEENNAE